MLIYNEMKKVYRIILIGKRWENDSNDIFVFI